MQLKSLAAALAVVLATAGASGCQGVRDELVWRVDNLDEIGGHAVAVKGDPQVVETPAGDAVAFDGADDAIFLDTHPLEGMAEFTVEVIFKPCADGASEQRFFHMQEYGSEARVMFETRLVGNDRWFLDTFVRSGDESVTLYAEDDLHPVGRWFHAAIIVADGRFAHYVNGRLELAEVLEFTAQGPGRTSLGVRINEVHWFKGAIRTVRITPRALAPAEFLRAARD